MLPLSTAKLSVINGLSIARGMVLALWKCRPPENSAMKLLVIVELEPKRVVMTTGLHAVPSKAVMIVAEPVNIVQRGGCQKPVNLRGNHQTWKP